MSEIKGKVGKFELTWKSVPRGPQGSAHVEIAGKTYSVAWRRDADGLWLELPYGVYGYDLEGDLNDDGRLLYSVTQRGGSGHWAGLSFMRLGEEQAVGAAAGAKKGVRVRAQMPGKIIRVLTQTGAMVEKDQPILVMEAMKMENEIRAPQAGKVGTLKVNEGQAVETGADLCVIEPV